MVLKKRPIYILIFLSFSFILTACTQKKVQNNGLTSDNVKAIKVQYGAVLLEENGKYNNLDFVDGKYENLKTNDIITNYNVESGTYIFLRDNKHYIYHDGKEIEIKDKNYNFMKISKDGSYVSYMTYDDRYKLKVLSLKNDKEVNIDSDVAISGDFYDFLGNDSIVYYGISNDNVNGVFRFNLNTKKEELLYKLNSGYVEFLKSSDDGVLILQNTGDNKSLLKNIGLDNSVEDISDRFKSIKDIIKVSGGYYVLGTETENLPSLYDIDKENSKRLVYSFPKNINVDKGLSFDKNKNILFIGSNDTGNKEEVFSYSNGSVFLVSNREGIYNFINVN